MDGGEATQFSPRRKAKDFELDNGAFSHTTFANLLLTAARDHGDLSALLAWSSRNRRVVERVAFRELVERATRFAEALASRGRLQPGDRVAVLSHATIEQFCAVSGILLAGQAAIMLNWRLPASLLVHGIETSTPMAIVASRALANLCDDIEAELGRPLHRFDILSRAGTDNAYTPLPPNEELDQTVPFHKEWLPSPQSLALVMFTSGSTGKPKAVPLTHANIVCSVLGKLRAHARSGHEVVLPAPPGSPSERRPTLSFLPNFHVIGLVNNFVFNILVQIPACVHYECADALLTIDVLRHAADALTPVAIDTVPHLLESLAQRARDEPSVATSFVRPGTLVLYGGAPLSSAAAETLEAQGARVAPHYGQTEFAGLVLIGEPMDAMPPNVPRGAMRPPPYPPSLRCELAQDGELVVRGSGSVTAGYVGLPVPEPPFAERRSTGDVFRCLLDETGDNWFLHVCRKDDVILHTSGEMTVPLPLEDAAYRVFALHEATAALVTRCVVIGQGRPSPVLMIEVASDVSRARDVLPTVLDDALKSANKSAPAYSQIHANRVIMLNRDEVPVSAKGNVVRPKLEALLKPQLDELDAVYYSMDAALAKAADQAHATKDSISQPQPEVDAEAFVTVLKRIELRVSDIVENIAGKAVPTDVPLLNAGLNSAGLVQLVRSLSAELDIVLAPGVVFEYPTVSELARKLAQDECVAPHTARSIEPRGEQRDTVALVSGATSCRFAAGTRSPLELYESILRAAVDAGGSVPPSRWDAAAETPAKYDLETPVAKRMRYGSFLTEGADVFDATYFGFSPAEASAMDPQQKLMLEHGTSALLALDGCSKHGLRPSRDIGVFAALMNTDFRELLGTRPLSTYDMTGNGLSTAGARLSFVHGLRGPCLVIDTACSSSLVTAYAAQRAIADHECPAALAPSANVMLYPGPQTLGPAVMGLTSPLGRCHTFDNRADGFLRAEGSVALAFAAQNGDYDVREPDILASCVVRHNGRAASFVAPNPASQAALVDEATALADRMDAQWTVELHGTGTALGDPLEVGGLATLRAKHDSPYHRGVRCAALKANLGHAEATAGAAATVAAALALHFSLAPSVQLRVANLHLVRDLAAGLYPILDNDEATDAAPQSRAAGCSSFGWSGVIAHAVFARDFFANAGSSAFRGECALSLYRNEVCRATTYKSDRAHEAKEHTQPAETPHVHEASILEAVSRVVAEALGSSVPQNEPLMALGLDSIAVSDFIDGLERELGTVLPATLIFDHPTVEAIASWVADQQGVAQSPPTSAAVMPSQSASPSTQCDAVGIAALRYLLPQGVTHEAALLDLVGCGRHANSTLQAGRAVLEPGVPTSASYGAFVLDDALAGGGTCFGMSPAEVRIIDPRQLVLVREAAAALNEKQKRSDVGVFVGAVGVLGLEDAGNASRLSQLKTARRPLSPYETPARSLAGSQLSIASGRVSYALGLNGPCISLDTACSSSLVAVHLASTAIRLGDCGRALAAGVSLLIDASESVALANLGMISNTGRCYTFDSRADGYARGEGVATIVLEGPSDSSVTAVAGPNAVRCDGASASLTAPNGSAQRALLAACAAPPPNDGTSVLEAHGTGTALGDPIEVGAANAALLSSGQQLRRLDTQSLKSNLGHLEHAAGAAGALALMCASLSKRAVAPSAQLRKLNAHLAAYFGDNGNGCFAPHLDASIATGSDGRVSSFGFSGTIAHARFAVDYKVTDDSYSWRIATGVSLYRNMVPRTHLRFRAVAVSQRVREGHDTIGNELPPTPAQRAKQEEHLRSMEDIVQLIADAAKDAMGESVSIDEPLMEAVDGDSMALGILGGSVSESLGVTLPTTTFFDFPTIRALATHLASQGDDEADQIDEEPVTAGMAARVAWMESASVSLPGAATAADIAMLSLRGIDAFSTVPPSRWDISGKAKPSATYGGFLEETPLVPDGGQWRMPVAEVQSADPKQLMILTESYAALEASRLSIGPEASKGSEQTAVFVGAVGLLNSSGGAKATHAVRSSYAPTGHALSVASGRLSYALALQGPSVSLDTACSTSLVAMHLAVSSLNNNESVRALAVAVAWNDETAHDLVANAGMLSEHGKCHTLDARANGYSRGEGCVALVLSLQDRAKLQSKGRVLGPSLVRQDGQSASLTAPNGSAQRQMIRDVALTVDRSKQPRMALLEAHGTGTALGDPIEVGSSHGALGSCGIKARYQSLKANIGHLEPAAGGAGVVAMLEALEAATAAPCAQLRMLNTHLASYLGQPEMFSANVGDATPVAPTFADGRVSSFGFSGTIAHTQHELVFGSGGQRAGGPSRFDGASLQVRASLFRQSLVAPAQAAASSASKTEARELQVKPPDQEQTKKKKYGDLDVMGIITSVVTSSFGREIPPDEPLMSAGLDSLGLSEMGADFVEKLGVELPATLLFDYPTINDVVDYVHTECNLGEAENDAYESPALTPAVQQESQRASCAAIAAAAVSLPGQISSEVALRELATMAHSTPSSVPFARWDPKTFGQTAWASSYGSFTEYRICLDNASFGMSPLESAANDPQQLRLLELSYAALYDGAPGVKQSGRAALAKRDYGVFAGATGVTWREDDVSYRADKPKVDQISALGLTLCVMSGRVSYALGLVGPCMALDTACSTTLATLHLASNAVLGRECSMALSSGVIFLREHVNAVLGVAGMTSPTGRCHTFDSRADGYLRGEGCVAYLLEPTDVQASPKRLVAGTAVRQDGPSANLTAPNGSSQRKLLRAVVEHPAADELVVEAHGTGTMLGDPIEVGGAVDVLSFKNDTKQPRRMVQMSSLKGNMGHLETAAGAAGVANLLVATASRRAAPNPELKTVNAHVATLLNGRTNYAMPVEPAALADGNVGRVSSFGFSGTIAHALVVNYTEPDADEFVTKRRLESHGVSLFRTATPYKPFSQPTLVAIQAAVGSGDEDAKRAFVETDIGTGGAKAMSSVNKSKASSKRAAIEQRRTDVRGALSKIFQQELLLDFATASVNDIDSIAMTQLVSSINDAFAIESEIGSYVVLDELDQTVGLVETSIEAAGPLASLDEEEEDASNSFSTVDRRLRNVRNDVEVEHRGSLVGSAARVVIFVHDESGTCAYVQNRLRGATLTLSTVTVLSIQAPELGNKTPTARIIDFDTRVSIYAFRVEEALTEEVAALGSEDDKRRLKQGDVPITVVGCGAAVAIGRALAAKMTSLITKNPPDFVAIDPCADIMSTRSALGFARAFYRHYCTAVLDELTSDKPRADAAVAAVDNAPADQAAIIRSFGHATGFTGAALGDLEEMCEFAFHINAMDYHKPPSDTCVQARHGGVVIHTDAGMRLLESGFRRGERDHAGVNIASDLLDPPGMRRLLGIDSIAEARKFAYVPFVNAMDYDDCLRCWKQPSGEAPSVIFVHGGIGVIGVAANYIKKLGPDVGLYVIQAPEHQSADYDWAPTPKLRAERYLKACISQIPNGGVLVGYSFAGNICFEMMLIIQRQRRLHRDHGGAFPYTLEFFLLEPVPPPVPTREPGECLLEHNARFVDKIMCEEFLPAVFGIDAPLHLDTMHRVKLGLIRTNTELLAYVVDRIGLDPRFGVDFERMMEFIYNLKLEKPTGTYIGDVEYLMILPDGYRHYELYWSYYGPLATPWEQYIDGKLTVHKTLKGNHFQAFDNDENMENVRAICDPLVDKFHQAQRHLKKLNAKTDVDITILMLIVEKSAQATTDLPVLCVFAVWRAIAAAHALAKLPTVEPRIMGGLVKAKRVYSKIKDVTRTYSIPEESNLSRG